MGHETVPVGQFHPEQMIGQYFDYPAFNGDGLFSGHVKISGSCSVIKTVCSKCAEGRPSLVTTVHPSLNISTVGLPALTIGSIAIVIPGRNFGDDFPSTKFGT